MGNVARGFLVLSFTSFVIVATPVLADLPSKAKCTRACNEFTGELVSNSDRYLKLTRRQRTNVTSEIKKIVGACVKLCRFEIVVPPTLGDLAEFLARADSGGGGGGGGQNGGNQESVRTPVQGPVYVTAAPVAPATPRPAITATPNPTIAATPAPELTATAEPSNPTQPYYPPGAIS
jgi:hypothetical protein